MVRDERSLNLIEYDAGCVYSGSSYGLGVVGGVFDPVVGNYRLLLAISAVVKRGAYSPI